MTRTENVRARRAASESSEPVPSADPVETHPTLLIVGEDDATDGICAALANIKATVRRIPSAKSVDQESVSGALGYVWNCVDLQRGFGRGVADLQAAASIPIYAVVRDEPPPRLARVLYGAGVAGVFAWPSEGLLLARYVAEMLSLRLVRGPAKSAQTALARTVRAHLRHLPMIRSPLQVDVDWGRVRLAGTIDSVSDRDEIEHRIAMIPGVDELDVSQLIVVPLPATDKEIRRACRSILAADGADRTVAVSVDSGVVRFFGTVSDRRIAHRLREMTAQVRGVREIDVALEVTAKGTQQDRRTQKRLVDLVAALYAESDVRVSFYDGVAVLGGSVKSLRLKRSVQRFVEQDAAVIRVVNKLEVVG